MIAARTFEGRSVALFGLGGSGLATARALAVGGARLAAWDDNPESVATARAEGLTTADLSSADWSGFEALVLSPGVPLTHPKPHWTVERAHAAGVPVIGDVELFGRERERLAPGSHFIAITGTNGKSTTTALIAHGLKACGRDTQLGGNIGIPVMSLDEPSPDRHYVVECSSYQIDLAPGLRPSVGILLNLTPDHLDRHGSMENYAAIKARLVHASDLAIVGVDDAHCRAIAQAREAAGRPLVWISASIISSDIAGPAVFFDGTAVVRRAEDGQETRFDLTGIGSLRGRHNGQNAAAAVAAFAAAGLTNEEIEHALKTFPGLAHRMEEVATRDQVLFVNDSKATNAEAAAPALASFSHIRWIVGGLPKQGGIAALEPLFGNVAKAYLIGEAAPAFAAFLGERVPYEISATLDLAVANAAAEAAEDKNDSVVLLSPACASFDQYRNFEVRGDAFRQAVARLPGIRLKEGGR